MTPGSPTCAMVGPGSRIVIDYGPLQGVAATVMLAEDDDSLTVLVSLLNESLVLDVPISGVVPAGRRTSQPLAH